MQGNVAAFTDAIGLFGNISDLNVSSSLRGNLKELADEGGMELAVELSVIQHVLDAVSTRIF
jgi:hypothetical protein